MKAHGVAVSETCAAAPRSTHTGRGAPRRRHRAVALLLGLVVTGPLALPSPAVAAPPKRLALTQVLRGEALERYEAAREDFKAQRFQQALAGFVRAYALSREPRLRWNAAACLRKLERNAEALRTLDAYLDEAERELTPEELEETRRSAEALRQLVATVRVSVDPTDAQVSIDGAPLEAAGLDVYLEPGRHAFLAQKPGFQPQVREQAVRAGERFAWAVTLAPLPAVTTPGPEVTPRPAVVEAGPPPAPATVRPRWAPWALAGGGLAAAAVGAVLLGTSAATFEQLRGECGIVCPPARWAGARDAEVAGIVLLSAGSALAAAGLGWGLWWSLDGAKAQLVVGPTRVSLEVRF